MSQTETDARPAAGRSLGRWIARFDTSPNRIALSYALRGTIAIAAPLLLLPPLGFAGAAHMVVIGALQTSIVDVGGPYGSRLRGMILNSIVASLLLLAGTWCGGAWWLAGLAMALVAVAGGLMRALGQGAAALGVTFGVALLIGVQLQLPLGEAAVAAAAYSVGGLWTILVALVVWRLRPYKRLEQEVGGIWEELAALTALLPAPAEGTVARRRQEQALAARQRSLRDAIERARAALGEARGEIAGAGTVMAQLLVLLRAAARIAMAEAALADAFLNAGTTVTAEIAGAVAALERTCRDVAGLLGRGRGNIALEAYQQSVRKLLPPDAPAGGDNSAVLRALALALRHLEAADDAAKALFGADHRMPGLLPPLEPAPPAAARLATFRAHLTLSSLIFRHALRVALSAGVATAIMVWFAIPHGMWLPLTALVVPQPEFGGTLRRALDRSLGTIGGAVLAAILLYFLHGTVAFEAAIIVLGFAAFLLLRRKYAFAIVFLTVLIMLLLGLADPDPWIDLRDRIVDTVSGAIVALVTAYLLWPQWEHERLLPRVAEALRANAAFLQAALGLLGGSATLDDVLQPRRAAEIATGNAEAAFQRMLAEPRAQRRDIGRAFPLVTHLRRLNQHLTALIAHLEAAPLRSTLSTALSAALKSALDTATGALAQDAAIPPFEPPEAILVQMRRELLQAAAAHEGLGALVGRIVSDVGAIYFAAASK
ncbi:MAG TPA: FUSC family protein [Candidatus Sulfotelmatobacter sp.]|nr:FUSC family protein [Candidatus Sulfotelmatobacter sp.]